MAHFAATRQRDSQDLTRIVARRHFDFGEVLAAPGHSHSVDAGEPGHLRIALDGDAHHLPAGGPAHFSNRPGDHDPAAIQVLVGENGAGLLAEVDHRLLTDHLKALAEMDALLGTGYDEMALAALTAIDFEPNLDPSITSHEVTDDDLRLAQDKLGKEPGERATLDLWCPACGHHYQVDPGEALMLAKRNDPTE